jgi:hypothetical protein
MQAQMDHLQASMPHSTPCPGSGGSTKANWSDSPRSHALSLHSSLSLYTQHHEIKTMSMRKAGYLSSWPASSCTKRSDIPGGLWFLVPTECIASPISTSISALTSLSLSLSLSRWFMHLWESKGLELWWVFLNFWELIYTNAPQKLIVKWNFGFTLQFCLM